MNCKTLTPDHEDDRDERTINSGTPRALPETRCGPFRLRRARGRDGQRGVASRRADGGNARGDVDRDVRRAQRDLACGDRRGRDLGWGRRGRLRHRVGHQRGGEEEGDEERELEKEARHDGEVFVLSVLSWVMPLCVCVFVSFVFSVWLAQNLLDG